MLVWTTCGAYTDALVRHIADDAVLVPNKPSFIVHLAHRIAHNCAALRLLRVSSNGFPLVQKGANPITLPSTVK